MLSDEKVWGCLFGIIPGIVFIWMSTNYTGQVINIELPLGLIIIGFYIGCGAGIYRKRYLTRREQEIPDFYKWWDELRNTRR